MGDLELQIFSDRLKELRNEKGLTQAQFVDGLGITASALSAYEKNLKNPSISVAKRIAEKYNVSIDWLCGLCDEKEQNMSNIKTYSDIIKIWISIERPLSALENVVKSFEIKMHTFLDEARHMEKLKKDGLIDDELYTLWIEKSLKKYHYPIMMHYTEKPDEPFSLRKINQNDLISEHLIEEEKRRNIAKKTEDD